jgi:nucleoside-diphosphate-sugar epimerase
MSSLGVYPLGHHRGTDETVPPKKSGDGYWDSKIDTEDMVLEAHRESGLPVTVIRPGYVYGPGDNHVLPRLLGKLKAGSVKYLGSGDQALSPIYIGNLVDIIFLALEKPEAAGQVYNVREAPRISKKQFVDKTAELAGYPPPTKHVPMAVAVPLAHLLHRIGKLLHLKNPPLLSKNRLKFMGMDLDYSCEKVKRELGWEPRHNWEQGLEETIEWFREQGRL